MINHGVRKYVDNFQPRLGPDRLPSLKWGERYEYLGVQRGRTMERSPKELADTIIKQAEEICNSALTDWQKLDALNTFVMTKASYHLSASIVDRCWCWKIDANVRKAVKKAMKLPKRTVSSFLYTSKRHGGLRQAWKICWMSTE